MDFEQGTYAPLRPDGNEHISVVSSPVRTGTRAALFELDRSAPVSYRTELTFQGVHSFRIGHEYWLGMSVFLPEDWAVDYSAEIVAQIHSWPDKDLGEEWRNPPIALYVTGEQWIMRIRADKSTLTRKGNGQWRYTLDKTFEHLAPIRRGQWTDWVFHIKYHYDSTGLLEAWADGKKVVEHRGPVTQNDKAGGFLKIGLYKWDWRNSRTATSRRALYIDEVRIAGAGAGYADVAPKLAAPALPDKPGGPATQPMPLDAALP
ncbi:polysaccharide lyase [Desulfocurvibacter africanus]|nr:polysaccharide lyase [Desulfocurvibacter africanus]